jgi:hypothetical protein
MKRTMAFLAAVCVSVGTFAATTALAQETSPPAPADTLKTDAPAAPAAPAPAPQATTTPARADTAAAAGARSRRARASEGGMSFVFSLGLGSAINQEPDSFRSDYDPAFGVVLSGGARRSGVTLAATFDYNFFFAGGSVPNDLNILMIFLDVKYMPVHSTARPYLLACGGYYRTWVVDTDYLESVLGYGGGVGVEVEIDRTRRLFFEGRYVQGQTRETDLAANTEVIPFRLGVTWEFR